MPISCLNCGKAPEQIAEYVFMAEDLGTTPDLFVEQEEGTYNPDTGKFWCTACYISLGMPLGVAR